MKKKGLEWSFLLIDDFAKKPLNQYQGEKSYIAKKGDVILELINAKENLNTILDSFVCKNYCRKHQIDSGLKSLIESKTGPDIILLDFLFSHSNKTQYGIEFLEGLLCQTKNENYKKGPFDKHWIFPVSVFSDAMFSSLQEKNIQNIEQDWNLVRGADPINSPHLFRSSLYEFMELQLKKVDYNEIHLFQFLAQKSFN